MSEVDQAQSLLDNKFKGQFIALPADVQNLALGFFEDKMTSALVAGRNRGNSQFSEAGIARLFMTEYLGIPEESISKAVRRAELRVEKIRKRIE